MEKSRSSFTGKIGFVLAAAGSAVGLGNIWRFPYLAAQYGGGIFLLVYLLLAITFGFALMCTEIAIGRKTGQSAINAYGKLNKKFSFIGWFGAVVPAIILPYYSVIGGWVTKYMTVYVKGDVAAAAGDSYFGNFVSNTGPSIGYFLLFLGVTAIIVLLGVEKGIEKVSKFMMPILIALTIFIAIYSMTLPGAMEGVKYYIIPNFDGFTLGKLGKTLLAAMGQLFYSMSLAMGIMITYGSYMKKEVSIEKSVRQIELFDTGIAFLAGLMVIPAVFAFSGGEADVGKGPSLMFVMLPKVFEFMGPVAGRIVGILFFLLVLFAALTSSISLMETVVSIIMDKTGWKRKVTCVVVFLGSVIIGLPSALGFGVLSDIKPLGLDDILTFFDFISNSVIMPIVALLTCIFVGYVLKPKALIEEIEIGGKFKAKTLFTVVIKYIAPVFITLILVSSVLDAFGIMKL